ncbi:hypothetical protein [Deinococcus frigens]|uniref:hypothetical protein n=1 Tax=Deinococcus frigens TaxID=249403 RepID=UPI00049579CE|nr:hypothetical protein [Deinococcus frigens]
MTGRRGRLARLEDRARGTSRATPSGTYDGLPLEDLRALYRDWTHNPAPRPELDTLALPELLTVYRQAVRGPA